MKLARFGVAVVVFGALLSGCSDKPSMQPGVATPSSPPVPAPAPVTLALTPAAETKDLPISTEIGVTLANGSIDSVVLADANGNQTGGDLRDDKTSWVPDKPLKFGTKYTATVTASGGGKTVTETTSFTTMSKPGKRNGVGLYLFGDREYGIAQPVVIEFTNPVPESARAGVQSRLFVTTTPPQPGVWSWNSSKQVTYRSKEYWKPGTKIEVRAGLEGHPMGDGRYGDSDKKGVGNISQTAIELIVENSTKTMTVKKNGEVIKTLPVSLGKASTPSASGTLVIMNKERKTVFRSDPGDPDVYVVDIEYAQRLTWSGQYIHAAPWSVKDQGVRNVSHGCVNVSMDNAKFLFDLTRLGDPVTVSGTEEKVESGDGFMPWSLSWSDYIKGSALPVPSELQ
nr:Ig-like domain-containing protein [Catelliglobosispora koreensis]